MPLLYPIFGTFISPSSTPPEEITTDCVDQFEYIAFLMISSLRPPVLVVHLKRFQQIAKTHLISFSHGFKKLDDYVTTPEYLDLTPFLVPREDYGMGKRRKDRVDGEKVQRGEGGEEGKDEKRGKGEERCMYRLYAVVVHIGSIVRPFLLFLRSTWANGLL